MEKNILNHYVLSLQESIERDLLSYVKNKKSERLHHLRVDIKKIKALVSFAEKVYQRKYDTALLKPLFHQAGEVRAIQINLQLLDTVPNLPEKIITQLRNKEQIASQKFIDDGPQHLMLIRYFRDETQLPKLLPEKKIIIQYFKKEWKKAENLLQHIDRGKLHRYRKKVKKILYIYEALPKKIQDKIKIDIAAVDQQQQLVGDWHDTYLAMNFLSPVHFPMQKSDYLLDLKEKEIKQFNTLRKNLHNNRKGKKFNALSVTTILRLCIPFLIFPLILRFSGNFRK
ncbi:CHAD domain-containing protein [Chryseobacterium sp.]|uniref:CHAD domain-containing protein n=1 Tax=Chryseobacterium sp. TaxID=1871047 RepID=UPI0011C8181B|nr:CHAD domain-containing protein [Chryseobacterium sp.]TXF74882.1 CHAD domain-containing protein [Chryseobacterium sp.]